MKHTEPLPPPIVNPLAVYSFQALRSLLGLAATTLKAERRAGRLRVGKRGNKWYVLGKWVIEWLEQGEQPSRRRAGSVDSASGK